MKTKVFIDGSEGTTGLRIHERLDNRDDIELLTICLLYTSPSPRDTR